MQRLFNPNIIELSILLLFNVMIKKYNEPKFAPPNIIPPTISEPVVFLMELFELVNMAIIPAINAKKKTTAEKRSAIWFGT